MSTTLERFREERNAAIQFCEQLLMQADSESRDLVETEQRALAAHKDRIAELDTMIAPLVEFQSMRESAAALDARIVPSTGSITTRAREVAPAQDMVSAWFESDQFRSYQGRGSSAVFEFAAAPWETRAVGPDPITTTSNPGKNLMPSATKFYFEPKYRDFPLLGLCTKVLVTSGNTIEVVNTHAVEVSGAGVVPENTQKPPITWADSVTPHSLAVVAGWIKATRQALLDQGVLRGLIENRLDRALNKAINAEAVKALNTAFTGANTTTGATKITMLQLVREAIGDLQSRGYGGNLAIAMNPQDHAKMDVDLLSKGGLAPVSYGSPFGAPIISLPDLAAGTAIVGDISQALYWFSGGSTSLYISDSDVSDGAAGAVTSDFRANRITFLAEQRMVMAPVDTSAVQKIVVTP